FNNPVFNLVTYTIPATGAFWLNDSAANIPGLAGSPTNNGLLRVTTGILNVETLGTQVMGAGSAATFTIEGGTLTFAGRLTSASTLITYNQSGGIVNVCTAGGCTTAPSMGFTGGTSVTLNWTAGTINMVQANTNAAPVDWNMTGATVLNFTAGTNTLN